MAVPRYNSSQSPPTRRVKTPFGILANFALLYFPQGKHNLDLDDRRSMQPTTVIPSWFFDHPVQTKRRLTDTRTPYTLIGKPHRELERPQILDCTGLLSSK